MKQKIILAVSLLVLIGACLAAGQLEIVSNMEEMLPADSQSLVAYRDFNRYFTGQDSAVIVVKGNGGSSDGSVSEQAPMFIQELGKALASEPYIASVFYRVNHSDMAPFAWAYLDISTFRALDDALIQNNFPKLTALLLEAETALGDGKQSGEYIHNDAGTHYLMFIRPLLDETDYMASRSDFYFGIQAHIRETLELPAFVGLTAGLTGGAFIQDIEADTVAFQGLFSTLGITFASILFIVVLFFGGLKLPLLSVYPLTLGTIAAAAAAYLIYGALNMFAVSFASLLLGLGIDYAIHLITRYQEERKNGMAVNEAVAMSRRLTGGSLIIGALTTALALAVFAFARFKAFRQMGIVSAIGIILLCAGMLILVPALISLFDQKSKAKRWNGISLRWMQPAVGWVLRRKLLTCLLFAVVIAALIPLVIGTDIKSDISAIYPKNIPSLQWAKEMESAFDYDIDSISFYADDEQQLKEIYTGLTDKGFVKKIDSVLEYMPTDMDEKLDIINRLDAALKGFGTDAFGAYALRRVTVDDLPADLRLSYVGNEGKLRVDLVPAINLYVQYAYDTMVAAIVDITGRYPVGMPVIMNEITETVKQDVLMISIFCFSLSTLIAWIMFKKFRLAILTMLPLALTLYIAVGLLSVLNIEINAFSIAAFPLIIGIGIDSSIHLIHRLNEASSLGVAEKTMHTGKAIILTALTTVIGFGSLAMINHPGMANLGLTVAIGITLSMVCTLVVVPLGYGGIRLKGSTTNN